MIIHSNIKVFDVFFTEKATEYGVNKHYYLSIYTQRDDSNNNLNSDIIGLLITTNKKQEENNGRYVVPVKINGKFSYVCCDRPYKFKLDNSVEKKPVILTTKEKAEIMYKLNLFLEEINRQMAVNI